MSAAPHVAAANQYIKGVLSGRIPACRWVKLACKRQRDDLRRAKDKTWPYVFDKAAAERVCRFLEVLPHIKGPLARKNMRLTLEPWQCFVVTTSYGWLHRGGDIKGKRRFRMLYLEVPRGNGKSALLSGLSLYALAADREQGAEVYSAAVTRDQAKIIFETSREMVRKRPKLRDALKLRTVKNAITQEKTASTFKPLASDEDSLEGLNIHFVAIDELHAHKKRAVYDVCESGLGKRDQPMLVVITTAGNDLAGICYEVRGYITKILESTVQDETTFGLIYTIDRDEKVAEIDADDDDDEKASKKKGDDWTSELSWRKANPNWKVSVDPVHLAAMAAKAKQLPSARPNFLTKHLNIWTNAATAWMPMPAWNRAADTSLDIEDFKNEKASIGVDLANKTDIASRVTIFVRKVADKKDGVEKDHYYVFARHYLNEAATTDGRNSQYEGWRLSSHLTVTPGDVTDYETIEDDLKADAGRFPMEVAYDPWQAQYLANNLQKESIACVEVRKTVANFSQPMKEIEALVLEGRFHHDGCPILTWMMSNVVCRRDAKGNIYPRKEREENKIDGVDATIMSMARLLSGGAEGGYSIYDDPALWSENNVATKPEA
ncbi:MAG: hypothetical protein K9G48_08525 [Reyranella sp.]|nr:hypothetical protein [Reyranella sp.]